MMIPEKGIVLDAGTGMFRVRDLIETETLDIFLSHIHLDHSVGLTFLYDILHERTVKQVNVHVAAEKIDGLRNHLYAEPLFPVEPNFELVPLKQSTTVAGIKIDSVDLEHPGGSHGFRMTWPENQNTEKSLAYITDTTATADAPYIDFVRDVDVLIHECYFPDGFEDRAALTGHSCLTPVAQIAAAAKAKELYLVHINPLNDAESPLDLDSVKEIFANTTVAQDRMVIEI